MRANIPVTPKRAWFSGIVPCLMAAIMLLFAGCGEGNNEEDGDKERLGIYKITVTPALLEVEIDPENPQSDFITEYVTVKGECITYGQPSPPECATFEPGWTVSYKGLKQSIVNAFPHGLEAETQVSIMINVSEAAKGASKEKSIMTSATSGSIIFYPLTVPHRYLMVWADAQLTISVSVLPATEELKSKVPDAELSSSRRAISFRPPKPEHDYLNAIFSVSNTGKTTLDLGTPYLRGPNADMFKYDWMSFPHPDILRPGIQTRIKVSQKIYQDDNAVYTAELVIPCNLEQRLVIPIRSQM